MFKTASQMLIVTVLVAVWLATLAGVGVSVDLDNGTHMRLRGWWKE